MLAAVRSRLPVVIAGAALLEFWLELTVLVPAGTPYRGLVAVLMVVLVGALLAGRRHPLGGLVVVYAIVALLPALSHTYYDELLLPFAAPFYAAYQLGMYASRRSLYVGLLWATPLSLLASVPYDGDALFTSGLFSAFVVLFAPVLVARLLRNRISLNSSLGE
jgi:hypothetical protein